MNILESTKLIAFHGTSENFQSFDLSKDFMKNSVAFFAKNERHATSFIPAEGGFLLKCELSFNRLFEPSSHWQTLAPLNRKFKSFWNDYTRSYRETLEERARLDGLSLEDVWFYYLQEGHWETYEGASIVLKTIKALKFDGIRLFDESDEVIYGAFQADRIQVLEKIVKS